MTNIDQVLAHAVDKTLEDSFERYYNKDLDLDEGKFRIHNLFRLSACGDLRVK